jgi:hypothetical protein
MLSLISPLRLVILLLAVNAYTTQAQVPGKPVGDTSNDTNAKTVISCIVEKRIQNHVGIQTLGFYDSLLTCGRIKQGFMYNIAPITALMGVSFSFDNDISIQFYFSKFQFDPALTQFVDPLQEEKPWKWRSLYREIPTYIRVMNFTTEVVSFGKL